LAILESIALLNADIERQHALVDAYNAAAIAVNRAKHLKETIAGLEREQEAQQKRANAIYTAICLEEESWQDQGSLPLWAQKHRTVKAIARRWDMGVDLVRELFADEPGVLTIDRPETLNKRDYTTRFIPASVISRVHDRWVKRKQRLAARHS